MDFTQNDFTEVKDLAKVQIMIDNIDIEYINAVSEEISKKQPFFLIVVMGFKHDTTFLELEELIRVFFLIWEYFRTNKKVQTIKVTEEHFETVLNKNAAMLQYADGELDVTERMKIFSSNLSNLKSKALLTAVFFRFNEKPVLQKMNQRKKGLIFINIKSIIECFETI
jgi:6-pyruvoyl-tetrahydropterin synthase